MIKKINFKPKLFDTIRNYDRQTFLADLSSGIIVGIVALPLSIAFAIASGVAPERGLLTAAIGGFLISFFGGSRVQIAGPTGAFIVVLYGIVEQFGLEGLLLATFMAGVMMLGMGLLKLGKIIQFMPYPITIGFTSGIAVIIFSTQVKHFFGMTGGVLPADFADKLVYYFSNFHTSNLYAVGLGLLTIGVSVYWSKLNRKIPGTLIAIVLTTALTGFFNLPVETIGSAFGELSATIPKPSMPWIDFDTFRLLIVPAFTIAMLGSIESLMSMMVSDGATGRRSRPDTELMAHGIANMLAPLFGAIPACGAVARTMTNVRNGGRTPISGIIHSLFILMVLLFLGKMAKLIPLSTLAGILFVVAYNMSEWRSFKGIFKHTKSDITVLLVTFLLTVFLDISVAIQFGLVLAAFLFVKRVSETSGIQVINTEVEDEKTYMQEDTHDEVLDIPKGVQVFQIKGPFFFGIANRFEQVEKELHQKPRIRILRMSRVPFIDSTGLKNFDSFLVRCRNSHIHIILCGIPPKPYLTLKKNEIIDRIGPENVCVNIEDAIARARVCLTMMKSS
ncbi:MAG: STAS domain-containing protein [Bacteroidetes bacterium]|nr:MAG: STAS domain-containing protein [Bacteroidota bacterium]